MIHYCYFKLHFPDSYWDWKASHVALVGKTPPASAEDLRNPWVRMSPWRRKWQPTDRGDWQAIAHRAAQSWTRLKCLSAVWQWDWKSLYWWYASLLWSYFCVCKYIGYTHFSVVFFFSTQFVEVIVNKLYLSIVMCCGSHCLLKCNSPFLHLFSKMRVCDWIYFPDRGLWAKMSVLCFQLMFFASSTECIQTTTCKGWSHKIEGA